MNKKVQNLNESQIPKLGTPRKYIGSVCEGCDEISNHDEVDEDICIHCKKIGGRWKHIYE
jgi:hypothetical protein